MGTGSPVEFCSRPMDYILTIQVGSYLTHHILDQCGTKCFDWQENFDYTNSYNYKMDSNLNKNWINIGNKTSCKQNLDMWVHV